MQKLFRGIVLGLLVWACLAGWSQAQELAAHLAPVNDPDTELVYPAGQPVQPPPGRYRLWLQGEWRMTPFSRLVAGGAAVPREGIPAAAAAGPAGRVRLPAGTDPASGLELHLLHAGSYLESGSPRWEIAPRKAVPEVGDGILLPAGKAVGALWDRKNRRYVALSRPFEVRERQTVEVPLATPGTAADLSVQLERHRPAASAAGMAVKLILRQEGTERAPDLAVATADRVYAFWYGLKPGPAELTGESPESFLATQPLQLQAGKIGRLAAELRPLPALEVQLDLPSALRKERPVLEVRRLPSGEVLAQRTLETTADSHRFESLPPALVRVELKTALGAFTGQADLTSGRDGFLALRPDLIMVTGTVYLGDEGHPARLVFANAARKTEVRSEDDGRYEAVFLEPAQTVEITLDGVDRVPYFDFFRPAIGASRELDFHLPAGDFRVKVLDAETGRGIPQAAVEVRNSFKPKEDEGAAPPESRNQGERAVFQSARTGETGEARLPPLREGSVEIRASAEGYVKSSQPLKAQIPDENADQTFELRLEPVGETVPLRLRLPGGAPAAAAQILLVDALASANELFSGRADGEGVVELPRRFAGILLVKHPSAGFLVQAWRPGDEEKGMEAALPGAAARPLALRVTDADGTAPAARAMLTLGVGGHRLSGRSLAWLTGVPPQTDLNGYWRAANLPQGPVSVLVGAQAVSVAYPWPELVEVRAGE